MKSKVEKLCCGLVGNRYLETYKGGINRLGRFGTVTRNRFMFFMCGSSKTCDVRNIKGGASEKYDKLQHGRRRSNLRKNWTRRDVLEWPLKYVTTCPVFS